MLWGWVCRLCAQALGAVDWGKLGWVSTLLREVPVALLGWGRLGLTRLNEAI